MLKFIVGLLTIAMCYAISWAITVGIIYLICLCFSLKFNLLIATGVWLILCLIKAMFPSKK